MKDSLAPLVSRPSARASVEDGARQILKKMLHLVKWKLEAAGERSLKRKVDGERNQKRRAAGDQSRKRRVDGEPRGQSRAHCKILMSKER